MKPRDIVQKEFNEKSDPFMATFRFKRKNRKIIDGLSKIMEENEHIEKIFIWGTFTYNVGIFTTSRILLIKLKIFRSDIDILKSIPYGEIIGIQMMEMQTALLPYHIIVKTKSEQFKIDQIYNGTERAQELYGFLVSLGLNDLGSL